MNMGCSILIMVMAFALASGEKLGDIEVITRGELGNRGLVPPDPLPKEQLDILSKVNANFVNPGEQKPEEKFIPLPALSYLPPAETPLPIESTEAPLVTTRASLPDEYLPPRGVADEIKPVVETPNILYSAPKPAPAVDQFVTEAPVKTQAYTQGPVYPIGVAAGAQPPLPIGPPAPNDDGYYLEEEEVGGKEGFFSGIRDSKLTLLGGIVGAKSAVLQGLRNAKDSIASGVTDALAHKAAAFGSLKSSIGSAFGGSSADDTYSDVNEGGYGSNTNVGVSDVGGPAGAGTLGGNFPVPPALPLPLPPIPLPPIPVPVLVPVTPASPYPIYPPYAEPFYPPPRPIYRPKLFESKKAAISRAISRVVAKFKAPFHHGFNYRRW